MAEGDLVERYLDRIGLGAPPSPTVDGVEQLMRAHLSRVPFENLDVYFQRGVATDRRWSLAKVLDQGRGGWCFELNGAFAALLESLGFDVRLLGAAVLLGGPSKVVDHLALEVMIEGRPYLVDVGFGEGFARPLPLNTRPDERLDGLSAPFGFMASTEGTTLVRYDDDDRPEAQYRFRRVALTLVDFEPASDRLYHDPSGNFRKGPVATRLLDGGPDRVTLTTDRLRLLQDGQTDDRTIEPGSEAWLDCLLEWFGIDASHLLGRFDRGSATGA